MKLSYVVFVGALSLGAVERGRVDAVAERMRAQIGRFDARLEKDPTPTMRDVTNCALAALNGRTVGIRKVM